jgi:hypothetical protein
MPTVKRMQLSMGLRTRKWLLSVAQAQQAHACSWLMSPQNLRVEI